MYDCGQRQDDAHYKMDLRDKCASWTQIIFKMWKLIPLLKLDTATTHSSSQKQQTNCEAYFFFLFLVNSAKMDLIYIDTNVSHKL